ncbi:MAG: T9SS type A sorting domain-containing protein [Flavobacteriales bacterium]|nr:T9SS type A sorting domain-containing protein [Flavobacteriales bacterium]
MKKFVLFLFVFINYFLSFSQPGSLDFSFNSIGTMNVLTSCIQPDGKILVGGSVAPYILRYNTDGSIDSTFITTTNYNVYIIKIQNDGKILVGGGFTTVNGISKIGLVRLNDNGSIDSTFNIGTGPNSLVYDISIQNNNKLIVAGKFSSFNGVQKINIIRLYINGSIDSSFNSNLYYDFQYSSVYRVKLQANNKILITGIIFSNDSNIASLKGLYRLNNDGSFDTSFNISDIGAPAQQEPISSIVIQDNGNIIISGFFNSYNGINANNIISLNSNGSINQFFNSLGSDGFINTIEILPNNKLLVGGSFSNFNGAPINKLICLNEDGSTDSNFIIGTGVGGTYISTINATTNGKIYVGGSFYDYNGINRNNIARLNGYNGLYGTIINDLNSNCFKENNEVGLSKTIMINPGNIITQSNNSGNWYIDSILPGNYNITVDTSGNWSSTCSVTHNVTISNSDSLNISPDFGFKSTQSCFSPNTSIHMPIIRPCTANQKIFVQACNTITATDILENSYVIVDIDSLITPNSFSIPYTDLGNNSYQINTGNLYPGQCVSFWIDTDVSCDAVIGQTLCMQANLYPADSCVLDTIPTPPIGGVEPCTLPWDHSSLSVEGWCANDSVYFSITNTGDIGNGDMQCYSPVFVWVDDVLTYIDSVLLQGGETTIYTYPATGQTWILEAEQHPLHPGNSHPNAHVELCGDTNNWTPGILNVVPQNDADPIVDIYCGQVVASYDPNDKRGFPTGVTPNHYIYPNGKIEYVIRFQNTGTDTAFNVIIRDTLDFNLDIFSVVSGASSHDYTFKMFGPRVLEWTFSNILLPDSTTDEPNSHGFVTFSVNQNPELPDFTEINNSVGIYFDFNEPVITNTTSHIVNRGIYDLTTTNTLVYDPTEQLYIYPNPAKDNLNVMLPQNNNLMLSIYSIDGKLMEQKIIQQNSTIDVSEFPNGMYFIQAKNQDGKIFTSKFIKE